MLSFRPEELVGAKEVRGKSVEGIKSVEGSIGPSPREKNQKSLEKKEEKNSQDAKKGNIGKQSAKKGQG